MAPVNYNCANLSYSELCYSILNRELNMPSKPPLQRPVKRKTRESQKQKPTAPWRLDIESVIPTLYEERAKLDEIITSLAGILNAAGNTTTKRFSKMS
jgi:hypothetical protein